MCQFLAHDSAFIKNMCNHHNFLCNTKIIISRFSSFVVFEIIFEVDHVGSTQDSHGILFGSKKLIRSIEEAAG